MNNYKIYLYQNDYISLLLLIMYLTNYNLKPDNIKPESYHSSLFDELIDLKLPTDEKQIQEILKFLPPLIFTKMYYVFLSDHPHKELILYYFYLNFKKYGKDIIYYRNLKCVQETLRISRYVGHEAHKLTGFLRFKEIDQNYLYAEMEPENNIIFLISKHFQKRLANESWIIRDVKRNLISIYNQNIFTIYKEDEIKLLNLKISKQEKDMQNLWKTFYQTVSIKERKNEKCQMNFMPKKYWKYIIEMSDEN